MVNTCRHCFIRFHLVLWLHSQTGLKLIIRIGPLPAPAYVFLRFELQILHLLPLDLIDRWQMVLYYIVLPVVFLTIPNAFTFYIILILYVHPRVVLEVSYLELLHLFGERMLLFIIEL